MEMQIVEKCIIGSLLRNGQSVEYIFLNLTPECFIYGENSVYFRHLQNRWLNNTGYDEYSWPYNENTKYWDNILENSAQTDELFKEREYASEVFEYGLFECYAEWKKIPENERQSFIRDGVQKIKENYKKYQIRQKCLELIELTKSDCSLNELSNKFDELYLSVNSKNNNEVKSLPNISMSINNYIQKHAPDNKITGLNFWDSATGGFINGEITTILTLPGWGKTSMAMTVANKAVNQGKKVVFISFDELAETLAARFICLNTGANFFFYDNYDLSDDDWKKLAEFTENIDKYNLLISDNKDLDLFELNKIIKGNKPDLFIIDSLNLIDRYSETTLEYIEEIASKYGVPIIITLTLDTAGNDLSKGNINWKYKYEKTLRRISDTIIYLKAELNDERGVSDKETNYYIDVAKRYTKVGMNIDIEFNSGRLEFLDKQ